MVYMYHRTLESVFVSSLRTDVWKHHGVGDLGAKLVQVYTTRQMGGHRSKYVATVECRADRLSKKSVVLDRDDSGIRIQDKAEQAVIGSDKYMIIRLDNYRSPLGTDARFYNAVKDRRGGNSALARGQDRSRRSYVLRLDVMCNVDDTSVGVD
jgi:hypothetical protein